MKIMKTKLSRLFAVSAAVGLCLICQNAFASPITVVQDYGIAGNPNSRDDLLNTLITATIKFDNGSLSGSGSEFIPAESVGLLFSDRGLSGLPTGLNFSSTVDPTVVHLFNALYVDGVYSKFGWQDDGGALFRARFSPEGPGINLISFTFGGSGGGGQLSFLISNAPRYNFGALGAPLIIPEPSSLTLIALATLSLLAHGHRRRRA